MSELVDKLHAIDRALEEAGLGHAFGGAIALAYCTEEPRGTRDIDLNIFVSPERAAEAVAGLPSQVRAGTAELAELERRGQARLWWDDTPVDVFLSTIHLHAWVESRVRRAPLAGREVPVLDCASLAVFKAYFDRTRDWADLEAMASRDTTPLEAAAAEIAALSGEDDPRRERLLRTLDDLARSGIE